MISAVERAAIAFARSKGDRSTPRHSANTLSRGDGSAGCFRLGRFAGELVMVRERASNWGQLPAMFRRGLSGTAGAVHQGLTPRVAGCRGGRSMYCRLSSRALVCKS